MINQTNRNRYTMGYAINHNGETWGVLKMVCTPSSHPFASAEQE